MTSSADPAKPGARRRALVYWGPVAVYCAAIFIESSLSSIDDVVPSFYLSDKLLHAAAYAVLAALVYRALGIHRVGADPARRWMAAVAAAVAYGITDEIHQSFVPGRSPEALDVVADGLGAIVGIALYRPFARRAAGAAAGRRSD